MTRRIWVLTNTATRRVIARGSLRLCRRRREFARVIWPKAGLPFVPDIRLAHALSVVDAARAHGAL